MIPVYINNFNRHEYLLAILQEFERFNQVTPIHVVVVDNNSSLPALLEWYDSKPDLGQSYPLTIDRMPHNGGPRGWQSRMLEGYGNHYIVCDPDIDFSPAPNDLFEMMVKGLVDFPNIHKTGPSLRITDVPAEHPWYDRIMAVEGKFFKVAHNETWWEAAIDTTCFAGRKGEGFAYEPALRAAEPYAVRHLPYYYLPGRLTAEERYYFEALPEEHKRGMYWTTLMKDSGVYEQAVA